MNIRILTRASLVLAGAVGAAHLPAQTVYRCANVYSQVPCAGGVAIDASDRRTPEQKAQTDAAARQAAASAEKLQRERIALEKRSHTGAPAGTQAPGHSGKPRAKPDADAAGPAHARPKNGRRPPEYFTAAVRPEEKEAGKTRHQPTGPADDKAAGPTARP